MRPESSEGTIASKVIFVASIAILLLIISACVYVIYGYMSPPSAEVPSATAGPSPVPTLSGIVVYTPTPVPTPTATPTPTPTATPTPKPEATPEPAYQKDFQITRSQSSFTNPGLWDNYVVYETNGVDSTSIYIYNLLNDRESKIAEGDVHCYGCIGEGKVAFIDSKDSSMHIYDIATGSTKNLLLELNKPRTAPVISDGRVLYCQDDGVYNSFYEKWMPKFSIYSSTFGGDMTSLIAPDISEAVDIQAYGDYVVWTTIGSQYSEIYMLNVKDGKTTRISPENSRNDHPRINSGYIVYHHSDAKTGNCVNLYNIETGSTTRVTHAGKQYNADIYGGKIVYDSHLGENWDIYMYDINTGKDVKLTSEPHDQLKPMIFRNRVAYLDNRNGVWDVFILNLDQANTQ